MITQAQRAALIAAIRRGNPGSRLADALEALPISMVDAYLADFAKRNSKSIARVRAGEDPRKVAGIKL